jgi:hypothetical protein
MNAPACEATLLAVLAELKGLRGDRAIRAADLSPVISTPAPSNPPRIGQPWPAQGGTYAGICRGDNGAPDYHLILCSAKPGRDLAWLAALEWAASLDIDGHTDWSVPNRRESALLFANLRDQVEPSWHWTSEQYSADGAWGQWFDVGSQDYDDKGNGGRVRAVRRLVIQSFDHS